tara:strand:- start:588 stop:2135 length:1548 start_codon:yes stop_codon:yes gene_type:complete
METLEMYNLIFNHNRDYDINTVKNQLIKWIETVREKNVLYDYYLLNTKNYTTNKKEGNMIEKFVFDTAFFHLNKYNSNNNTNYNIDDIFIEFWPVAVRHFKKMHFDRDEYSYIYDNEKTGYAQPFLSCITYFDDNNDAPTLITNVTRKYNSMHEIEVLDETEKKELTMVFPRNMIQMTFNGGKYLHGMYLLNKECAERKLIAINFFTKRPKCASYFPYYLMVKNMYNNEQLKYILDINKNILYDTPLFEYKLENKKELTHDIEVLIQPNFKNKYENWFNNLIKGDNSVDFSFIMKHIEDAEKNNKFIHHFKFTFGNNSDEINIQDNTIDKDVLSEEFTKSKYNNRFIYKEFITHDICDWIIYEAESFAKVNGWMTQRHGSYPTTDIPITNISKIYSFFQNIKLYQMISFINNSYNINLIKGLEIDEGFIVKYDADDINKKQTSLGMHTDNCHFTCSILLNSPLEFEGGGVKYAIDDLVYYSNKGDMILHSHNAIHSGLEITKGKRYVLVFFLIVK